MNRLAHVMARPLLEAVTDLSMDALGVLPVPPGDGRVHAPGPTPDRLLMIGAGAVTGIGVVSHEVGLAGQLARRVSAATSRGVDLESFGQRQLSAEGALSLLADLELRRYDAVIFEIGGREAVGLRSVRLWRDDLRAVLDAVRAVPLVFVFGIPPITQYVRLPAPLDRMTVLKIAQLNVASAQVAAEYPNVVFVPFSPIGEGEFERFGSVATYERWADHMAPAIAARLDPSIHRNRQLCPDESARQSALDAMHVVDSEADARIDRIARTARDLLGATGASVTLLDHDRQWIKSAISMDRGDTERAISFCNTTISRPDVFVVEDATEAAEFADHPWVVGDEHVRFYAGYPVEAPNGERVGALCIVDTKPRRFSNAEAALLRELALRVQELLWTEAPDVA